MRMTPLLANDRATFVVWLLLVKWICFELNIGPCVSLFRIVFLDCDDVHTRCARR